MKVKMIFYFIIFLIFLASAQNQIEESAEPRPDFFPENQKLDTKECRERERLISSEKDDPYALVDAVEGQRLVLRCRFCNEESTDQPKNWYKIKNLGVSLPLEVVPDTNNDVSQVRISINHKRSLIIENFTEEDTGFYYCVHFEDKTNKEKFNFLVDLVENDNISLVKIGNIADWSQYHDEYFIPVNNMFKSSRSSDFVQIREYLNLGMELVTQWGVFGQCEVCGRPQGEGIMKKKGSCRIKLTLLANSTNKLKPEEIYFRKAPATSCKSQKLKALFPQIFNLTKEIPEFVLQEKCDGICSPDAEGINKGWKVGKGMGFKYRRHFVIEEHSSITLTCPESSLDNDVVWKRNGRVIKKGNAENTHVVADTFGSLYIIKATPVEKGNYTCEVDKIRMQQVMVFVASKSTLLTNELIRYMAYLSFILCLSSFCYCAGLIITCQKRHTFKGYTTLKEEASRGKPSDEVELLS